MTLDFSTLCFLRREDFPPDWRFPCRVFDVGTDWLKVRAVTRTACRTLTAPRRSEGYVWFIGILCKAMKAVEISLRRSRVAQNITWGMKWSDCDATVESAWLMFGSEEFNAAYLQDIIWIAAILNYVFKVNPKVSIHGGGGGIKTTTAVISQTIHSKTSDRHSAKADFTIKWPQRNDRCFSDVIVKLVKLAFNVQPHSLFFI